MWRIIICAVILVVCSGQLLEENPTTPEKDKDPTSTVVIQESPTPPPPTPSIPTEAPQLIAEVTKPVPETEIPEPAATVELEEENGVNSKRRVVTYDQRQEGHHQSQQANPHIIVEEQPAARISEFIEGRTPYRVDISSTNPDLEQLQLQQQYQPQQPQGPQVDVLPPPYPLSYQHLIKPFHLEAEPTVIQALPPQSVGNNGKFMDANGNFFRMARAIPGGSLYGISSLDSNRVQPRQRPFFYEQYLGSADDDEEEIEEARSIDLPLNNDSLEGAIHNYIYPPLNPLRFNPIFFDLSPRAMQSQDYPKYNEENAKATDIELKLLGATEECGPDRKRDSYGICRLAEGY